jgi:hypothetical protein
VRISLQELGVHDPLSWCLDHEAQGYEQLDPVGDVVQISRW